MDESEVRKSFYFRFILIILPRFKPMSYETEALDHNIARRVTCAPVLVSGYGKPC
jgi:hypothetical protein